MLEAAGVSRRGGDVLHRFVENDPAMVGRVTLGFIIQHDLVLYEVVDIEQSRTGGSPRFMARELMESPDGANIPQDQITITPMNPSVAHRDYDGDVVSPLTAGPSEQINNVASRAYVDGVLTARRTSSDDIDYADNRTMSSVIEDLEKRIAELEEQKQDVKHIKVNKDEAVIFICNDDYSDDMMEELIRVLKATLSEDTRCCVLRESACAKVIKLSKQEVRKYGEKIESIRGDKLQSKRFRRVVRVLGGDRHGEKESR